MNDNQDIIKIAEAVLTSAVFNGAVDNWLWDRAQRIERIVNDICQNAEIKQANLAIDLFCLKAAVYFFQTGHVRAAGRDDALYIEPAEVARLSANVVKTELSKVIDERKIDKINNIMLQTGDKAASLSEAKILSDAINLDDIGAAGVFNQIRASALHKKSASDFLNSYKKKVDYGYWQARLSEGFHFKSTEKLANKRFAIMNTFMQNLEKSY